MTFDAVLLSAAHLRQTKKENASKWRKRKREEGRRELAERKIGAVVTAALLSDEASENAGVVSAGAGVWCPEPHTWWRGSPAVISAEAAAVISPRECCNYVPCHGLTSDLKHTGRINEEMHITKNRTCSDEGNFDLRLNC